MPEKIKHFGDSLVVILLGVFILCHIYFQMSIAEDLKSGLDSPVLFPKIVGFLLIGLGLFQTISIFFKQNRERKEEREIPDNRRFAAGLIIVLVYVLLIPVLGFLIASVLTIYSLVYVFQKVKWYKAGLYSVMSSIVIWAAFEFFLQISLPAGFLGI
ncbi:tripartite tricarboxylate transporter TctB family protein [Salibacterium aidingense]|uniref:tripartite tricarboxylate transporter TctB family protein n=1 Tax=Salibacterium aidingense TaxID=384933 RepID=UPI003BC9B3B5